jgi:hypothetical protein
MSALVQERTSQHNSRDVRFVPKADIAANKLFDHLVGAHEQCWWNFDAERLGGGRP